LPDGNGLDVAENIRKDAPPFILVSGDTTLEVLQAVNARGLPILLHKPVRSAKLRSLALSLSRGGGTV
jgi:CheY-like chemotaxis protein